MSVEFYKMPELQRSLRNYILEDLESSRRAIPIMVCAVRTMDYSAAGIEKRIMQWLKETDSPVETFQIFPMSYIVFYDMSDVLMLKLAVDFQE